ncbi:MAG TPA: hypothetical protein VJ875_05395 [Pyrinomonadaceae bacterium]|nr:hypothetical protein [Pyrinomonadaceae bacterium]
MALSFVSILLPIATSANISNEMPCCAGKSGHCDSGIAAKKPPKFAEPMCGLHNAATEDDSITIVVEPLQSSSANGPAVKSVSLTRPCRMECGVCTAGSSRQQNRERAIARALAGHTSPAQTISRREDLPRFISSNDEWSRTIPRGPPASSI